jgi:hypothetical protein
MFAQGQLLGMQTDLLFRLKTEINACARRALHSLFFRAVVI